MAAGPPPLTSAESAAFDNWFQIADVDRDGVIGEQDAAFFGRSGLSPEQLLSVWKLADEARRGVLNQNQFGVACRAIGLLQSGETLTHFGTQQGANNN